MGFGGFDLCGRAIAVGMVDATGVPEVVGEGLGHHLNDAAIDGGGSVVVEVDGRHWWGVG